MVTIWVNQWFSTMYHIILQIKDGMKRDGIETYIIGSSGSEESVYRLVCDEYYKEPVFDNAGEYVMWCLEFCKRHNVNVFIPKKHFIEIAKQKHLFNENGIKVMVENNYELLKIFNNKVKTADYFKTYLNDVCSVPFYEVVTNVDEFEVAYQKLKMKYKGAKLCVKYVEGEGGISFKIIDESPISIKMLESTSMHYPYGYLVQILSTQKNFKPLIVMPYLNGMEVSIDCVPTGYGAITVPRLKGSGRVRIVDNDKRWNEKINAFLECTKLKCPFNIQFKYHEGKLFLLEVNTRMSGGIHYAYYSGVNLPYYALCELLEIKKEHNFILQKLKLSYIEKPIVLDEMK